MLKEWGRFGGLGIGRRAILCWILQEWYNLAENGEGCADFMLHSTEPGGPVKDRKFLGVMSDSQIPKKAAAAGGERVVVLAAKQWGWL